MNAIIVRTADASKHHLISETYIKTVTRKTYSECKTVAIRDLGFTLLGASDSVAQAIFNCYCQRNKIKKKVLFIV